MKLSLITRLSSLVTIVHGHTRFARQAEEVSPVVECLDTSEQCETWKIMNLCSVDSIKTSCPKSCDDCDNIAAQTQNNNSSEENTETCEDIIEGCSNFSSQCDKINIRNGCRKTCNLCAIDAGMGNAVENQLCQDRLPACGLLAARTGCQSPAMKTSCALTCGTCKDLLEPILNDNRESNRPDFATTAFTTDSSTSKSDVSTSEVETEDTISVADVGTNENSKESEISEKSEKTESSEKSEVEITTNATKSAEKTSDVVEKSETPVTNKTEEVETPEDEGSSDGDIIEIDDAEPTETSAKKDNSTIGITVVTTEANVSESSGSDASSSICLSVLVVAITFLVQ